MSESGDCIILMDDYQGKKSHLDDESNKKLKERLITFLNENLTGYTEVPSWREIQTKLSEEKGKILFDIRSEIAKVVKSNCDSSGCDDDKGKTKDEKKCQKKCKDYGSTSLTSDIDISIENGDNCSSCDITMHIDLLKELLYILLYFFDGVYDKLFPVITESNINSQLKKIHEFLDLNLYLTNFFVKKPNADNNEVKLENYYISDCPIQYLFAIADYINYNKSDKTDKINAKTSYPDSKDKCGNDLQLYNQYTTLIEYYNTLVQNVSNVNQLINTVSAISLYEDESYHTQGSFVDVVITLQRKINIANMDWLRSVSFIENLCLCLIKYDKYKHLVNDKHVEYANTIKKSSIKYFYRAMRAYLLITKSLGIFKNVDIPFITDIKNKIVKDPTKDRIEFDDIVSFDTFLTNLVSFDQSEATQTESTNGVRMAKYPIKPIIEQCIKNIIDQNSEELTGGKRKKASR